jgi:mycobactin peptide synthetase MbtE
MIFQNELLESLVNNHKKTAIETDNKTVTYSELLYTANKITYFLLNQGLEKETVVGISLQDRHHLIAAMIGVLNSRCVFVPVDTSLPEERLSAMISNIGLQYLITSDTSGTNVAIEKSRNLQKFRLDRILDTISDLDLISLKYPSFNENDSIYLYFTSGSTGIPKGIIGKNKSLLQFLKWETKTFNITTGTRVSQFVSPFFDAFLRDVFAPLLSGGIICIPPQEESFISPDKMADWLDEKRIELVHCVPGIFRAINKGSLTPQHFKHLRYILLSGERIIPAELAPWYAIFDTRVQLVNLYGTTETTMIRAFYCIPPEDAGNDRIPIGYPIDDTELLIAGKDLKPCQPLVPGELYIVSAYTTKGYLNAPELTNEKFIILNAGTPNEKIAFKTGDTARALADGKIDLMGRDDRQVKVRGIRIELDEIENRLLRSGLIENALVVKIEENGNESLVAFMIRHKEVQKEVNAGAEAETYLRQYLPAYMIPANIVEVSAFPLLRTGKINQQELLKSLEHHPIIAPENTTEEKILLIWKQILGDKPISVTDSFNRIGGNSLNIMRLIGILYREFNVHIALFELFENLTIKKQAVLIGRSKKDNLLSITPAPHKPSYNLTAVQERIYYYYLLNKKSTTYNMPIVWTINGTLNVDRIRHAMQLLIERHESLRTTFSMVDHVLQQIIEDVVVLTMEEVTRPTIPEALASFIRPFELEKGPLLRCGIILSGNAKLLVVDMHHIICDGMSQEVLREDFLNLYQNKPLAPLQVQYKDFAEWEFHFRTTNEYLLHREFWLQSFEGAIPKLDLPARGLQDDEAMKSGGSIVFSIPKSIMSGITHELNQQDVSAFSALFAAYFLFLHQLTAQEDIVIGTNTTGRIQDDLQRVSGMFAKTLPIRYSIDLSDTFKTFAQKLNGYLLRAYSHQTYDLADIVNEVTKRRATPIDNLFDTVFAHQNFETIPDGGNDFTEYSFTKDTSKYLLTLMAFEVEDFFHFRLEYATTHFSNTAAELLVSRFKSITTQIASNMGRPMKEYLNTHEPLSQPVTSDIIFNF